MMDNKVLCVQLVPDPVQPVGVTGCDAAHCRRQMFTNNKQQQEDLQHLAAHVAVWSRWRVELGQEDGVKLWRRVRDSSCCFLFPSPTSVLTFTRPRRKLPPVGF